MESPALMAMCFQQVMGALQYHAAHHLQHQRLLRRHGATSTSLPLALAPPIPDPLGESRIVRDQVHVLLSCLDTSELFERIFQDDVDDTAMEGEGEGNGNEEEPMSSSSSSSPSSRGVNGQAPRGANFWRCMRRAVEGLFGSKEGSSILLGETDGEGKHSGAERWLHNGVGYTDLFAFPSPKPPGIPLSFISYINCIKASESVLRCTMSAALSASAHEIPATKKGLITALAMANIIPATPSSPSSSSSLSCAEGITAEGLNFCMMPMSQQWWVLLSTAVDRVFSIMTQQQLSNTVTKKAIWHRLALLCMLDTSHHMYAFPDRIQDPVAYQLLARLSEIGLVYPVKGPDEERCFVVSPHLRHGIQWEAATPVCSTSLLHSAEVNAPESLRLLREQEMDTIITETNYRLFVYSINPDLLRVVEAFAVREEVVNEVLVCFRISRDSFCAALEKGLTALQVMQFLSSKAHPCMTERYGISSGGATTIADGTSTTSDVSLCLPQSFVDQLLMWESEFFRVTFTPNMVLLQNVTTEQKEILRNLLRDYGELDAMVHEEVGLVVIREDVYNRLLARYISS